MLSAFAASTVGTEPYRRRPHDVGTEALSSNTRAEGAHDSGTNPPTSPENPTQRGAGIGWYANFVRDRMLVSIGALRAQERHPASGQPGGFPPPSRSRERSRRFPRCERHGRASLWISSRTGRRKSWRITGGLRRLRVTGGSAVSERASEARTARRTFSGWTRRRRGIPWREVKNRPSRRRQERQEIPLVGIEAVTTAMFMAAWRPTLRRGAGRRGERANARGQAADGGGSCQRRNRKRTMTPAVPTNPSSSPRRRR